MDIDEESLEGDALRRIADWLVNPAGSQGERVRPAVLCSFGKDSMVVLDLVARVMGKFPPVIVYRDPWFRRQWKFADDCIARWDLEVYSPPPADVWLYEDGKSGRANIGSTYPVYAGEAIDVPRELAAIERDKPGTFRCGLNFLHQPTGWMNLPFDLLFSGHRGDDTDPTLGDIGVRCDEVLLRPRSAEGRVGKAVFPLREWSERDVWDYIHLHQVQVDPDRYDTVSGKPLEDKRANTDYLPVCIDCLRAETAGRKVYCPLLRSEIPSCAMDANRKASLTSNYFGPESAPNPNDNPEHPEQHD